MLAHVHLTRVVNEPDKKYGFGLLDDGTDVYIPGAAISSFDMSIDDVGGREKAALIPDPSNRTGYIVTTFLDDDSKECAELRDEVERLRELLEANGVVA